MRARKPRTPPSLQFLACAFSCLMGFGAHADWQVIEVTDPITDVVTRYATSREGGTATGGQARLVLLCDFDRRERGLYFAIIGDGLGLYRPESVTLRIDRNAPIVRRDIDELSDRSGLLVGPVRFRGNSLRNRLVEEMARGQRVVARVSNYRGGTTFDVSLEGFASASRDMVDECRADAAEEAEIKASRRAGRDAVREEVVRLQSTTRESTEESRESYFGEIVSAVAAEYDGDSIDSFSDCKAAIDQTLAGDVLGVTVDCRNASNLARRAIERAIWAASPLPKPTRSGVFERRLNVPIPNDFE